MNSPRKNVLFFTVLLPNGKIIQYMEISFKTSVRRVISGMALFGIPGYSGMKRN